MSASKPDERTDADARQWIPVGQMLPMDDPVLGVFDDGSQMVVRLWLQDWQDAESREELLKAPVAWMPLPPPPDLDTPSKSTREPNEQTPVGEEITYAERLSQLTWAIVRYFEKHAEMANLDGWDQLSNTIHDTSQRVTDIDAAIRKMKEER